MNFSLRVGSPLDGTSDTAKFLGVYLDKKLTWEEHAINLGKRLPKIIFLIKNLTKSMSISTVLAAYHSYFVSVASYSILNWGHSPHSSMIFKLQRRCVRVMAGLKYRECCRCKFIELGILTLPCIYMLQCLVYTKRNINLYSTHSDNHEYNTRSNSNLALRFLRLARSRNGSGYYGPKLFNGLPFLIFGGR